MPRRDDRSNQPPVRLSHQNAFNERGRTCTGAIDDAIVRNSFSPGRREFPSPMVRFEFITVQAFPWTPTKRLLWMERRRRGRTILRIGGDQWKQPLCRSLSRITAGEELSQHFIPALNLTNFSISKFPNKP